MDEQDAHDFILPILFIHVDYAAMFMTLYLA